MAYHFKIIKALNRRKGKSMCKLIYNIIIIIIIIIIRFI